MYGAGNNFDQFKLEFPIYKVFGYFLFLVSAGPFHLFVIFGVKAKESKWVGFLGYLGCGYKGVKKGAEVLVSRVSQVELLTRTDKNLCRLRVHC